MCKVWGEYMNNTMENVQNIHMKRYGKKFVDNEGCEYSHGCARNIRIKSTKTTYNISLKTKYISVFSTSTQHV